MSYEEDADGVTVTLADGTTARGDLLVGADGIRSAVRSQLLPEVPVIPTGIKGIGIYGRTPLTPELDELLPSILDQGVLMAVDRKGSRLLVANFRPRRAADEAAAEIAPDVVVDPVPAYAMISCSVAPGTDVPPVEGVDARDGAGDAGVDAHRDRGLAPGGSRAGGGHRAGVDVHDPVRLPRAGRELGAVAGDDRRRRRPRHAPDARAWAPTCRSTTRRC